MRRSIFTPTNHLLTILVMALFLFVQCSDDDSESPVATLNADDIIGTWSPISSVTENCNDPDNNESITFNCPDFCYMITLEGSGTFSASFTEDGFTIDDEGTYQITDNRIELCEVDQAEESGFYCYQGVAAIANNQLSLVIADENDAVLLPLPFQAVS